VAWHAVPASDGAGEIKIERMHACRPGLSLDWGGKVRLLDLSAVVYAGAGKGKRFELVRWCGS
jgi:hypothetical protein